MASFSDMSAFGDMFKQAKSELVNGAQQAKAKIQAKLNISELAGDDGPPSFEATLAAACKNLQKAQQSVRSAVSLAPSDAKRAQRRDALSAVHENIGMLMQTLQTMEQEATAPVGGKATQKSDHASPKAVTTAHVRRKPHPPPSTPAPPVIVDLLGGQTDFFHSSPPSTANDGIVDLAGATDDLFADFGDGNAAPAQAPIACDVDLLGGFGSVSPPGVSSNGRNASNASSVASLGGDGLEELLGDGMGPPGVAKRGGASPSLDDLIHGMSASEEIHMAAPLMPEDCCGGATEPAKRLKLPTAMVENAPHEPQETASQLEKRVATWSEGKNLQAMLATLHEIIPKCCRWEPRTLGALLDESALKDAYKLALIAVHTDKLIDRPEWEKERCQLIFNCLRRSRPRSSTAA